MGKARQRQKREVRAAFLEAAQERAAQKEANENTTTPDSDPSKNAAKAPVHAPPPVKHLSKKQQKKLNSYIDQKLKKEAREGLMDKLSHSSWSSDLLKSSKLIGRSGQTLREKLRQTLLEQKAGMDTSEKDIRLVVETEVDEEDVETMEVLAAFNTFHASVETPVPSQFGSALRQTTEGPALPLVKRKRKKKASTIPASAKKKYQQRVGVESDDSFDSSDSANDSDSEEEGGRRVRPSIVEECVGSGVTAMEEVIEAAKNITVPLIQREEEVDEVKLQLLKSNREGDLSTDKAKHFFVTVDRTKEIREARLQLPVCGEEQVIMEAIRNNTVVVICGETGSGKTTQVPQFLYEAGWSHPDSDNPGLIAVTQPRRVAAVSMAKRVAHELNLTDKQVSHQIRFDVTTTDETRIKFMTDGVLLRELSQDLLLTKYSVIIIDEAHERNLNTDILIGVVSRVLKLRAELSREDRQKIKPLRVVIMSATLRVSDFTQNSSLFATPPPVINVNARQYPVSVHFNKRTPDDYVAEAFKKVSKIHERLPEGGVLIFLTGQNEIQHLCKLLRQKYPALPPKAAVEEHRRIQRATELESKQTIALPEQTAIENEEIVLGENQVEDFDLESDEEDSDSDLGFDDDELVSVKEAPLHVLPLYSSLPTEAQLRAFQPPPEGTRLCVIATNVAETSVTIPGIRYVVDCGKVKERRYELSTGVQSFEIDWTSKASSGQRSGRAGRTGPGHCYRLYSSAVFDHEFEQFSTPEISRMPIEGVVLNMKSMGIENVINFPFPTPPLIETLFKAEKLLGYLGAVDRTTKRMTDIGQAMSNLPVTPRFAKMLVIGHQQDCLAYVIAIVAALSVGDPFIQEYHLEEEEENSDDTLAHQELQHLDKASEITKAKRRLMRKKFFASNLKHAGLERTSDILKLLNVVGAYEYSGASAEFCQENFLRVKAMKEIRKLRWQLTNLMAALFEKVDVCVDPKMLPPNKRQIKFLRQVLTAGLIDSVAVRKDVIETGGQGARYKNCRGVAYKLMWSEEEAFVHPGSILYGQEPPVALVYNELFKGTKTSLKGVTAIDTQWLSDIGKDLCSFGRPLEHPIPKQTAQAKDRKTVYVVPSFGPKGWPLPPIQAEMYRKGTRWVMSA
ncbi:P-loop containing nucleoside triphosphate hydrolase protein [Spinellus fusiger]|nr:P-loop containing nucleoside triphosphate hydrolase protein [Spinellus fusiger]